MGSLLNVGRGLVEKGPTIIMTNTSNAPVLAICYAQGWCANSTYMTDVEAAAVTDIGTAFNSNTNITHFEELQYFTGLTTIPSQAFAGCTKLKSVTIPNSVTLLSYRAFYNIGTTGNQTFEVVIPSSVVTLNNDVFRYSSKISKIYVPSSVTTIGTNAFASIKIICWNSSVSPNGTGSGDASAPDATAFDSDVYTVTNGMLINGTTLFASPTKKTNAYVPNGITNIGANAYKNSATTSLIIPEGVVSIQYRGFYGKAAPEWILPSTTTSVYGDAFRSGNWHKLYLPSGITDVHGTCFAPSGNATNIVVVNKTTPPTNDSRYTFTSGNNYHFIGYVPQGCISNYPIAANAFFDVWYVQEVREIPSWFDHTDYSSIQTSLNRLYSQETLTVKATITISSTGNQCIILDSSTCDAIYVNGRIVESPTNNYEYNFTSTGTFKLRYVMNTSDWDSTEVFGDLPIILS